MDRDYTYVNDLKQMAEIPKGGVLSRTVYSDERVKVVVFGFDAGQELSEHTASMPAIVHILQGEARLTLGEESREAHAGAWVHMPPRLPHSLYAVTPVVMMLLLLKTPKQSEPGSAGG